MKLHQTMLELNLLCVMLATAKKSQSRAEPQSMKAAELLGLEGMQRCAGTP